MTALTLIFLLHMLHKLSAMGISAIHQ